MHPVLILFLILFALGFALWALKYMPLDDTIKKLIHGLCIFLAVLIIVLAVLSFFGVNTGINIF